MAQVTASIRLPIGGMTCQSCVRNIESTIRTKAGIVSIKVNLQEKAGYIEYDPHIIDPHQIANEIDDMGFDCVYENGANDGDDEHIAADIVQSNRQQLKLANISIDGMHCQSCVNNIEGTIGKERGIERITVILDEKMAMVEYRGDNWTAAEIAEMISDMGFTTAVIDENGVSPTKQRNGKMFCSTKIGQQNQFYFVLFFSFLQIFSVRTKRRRLMRYCFWTRVDMQRCQRMATAL